MPTRSELAARVVEAVRAAAADPDTPQPLHEPVFEGREVAYLTECMVCPVSIGHIPGNRDPHRVPDFPCAFNLVMLGARDRFQAAIDPRRILRDDGPESDDLRALAALGSRRR